ncbi:Uncharacterized protein PBTT_09326 [Plasmodiophora brassicae]
MERCSDLSQVVVQIDRGPVKCDVPDLNNYLKRTVAWHPVQDGDNYAVMGRKGINVVVVRRPTDLLGTMTKW